MARRRRSPFPTYVNNYNNRYGPARRGLHLPTANLRLSKLPAPIVRRPPSLGEHFHDRRRFYPDTGVLRPEFRKPHIPPSPNHRRASRLVIDPFGPLKQAVRFAIPKKIKLCVDRKKRREVIMATGKGGGAHRKPRRNEFSSVRC